MCEPPWATSNRTASVLGNTSGSSSETLPTTTFLVLEFDLEPPDCDSECRVKNSEGLRVLSTVVLVLAAAKLGARMPDEACEAVRESPPESLT
eukprot:CAMPEP_0206439900 /NCGR_PEP_ID=MMETSP0324_2-20121206/12467_1 /ASSEMBLY_ACC=CAM_ASM_000836 /TAXON_ID=2866 /ORGANISM="Crypthecodinium cohnii, Strain Seligo" /LENGTH=92 /DNA_ID=CAMNT_0053907571 /DNA_START=217 /DNA_END=491 /DNA_ORIENTATION=-